jgi:transcription elongation factor
MALEREAGWGWGEKEVAWVARSGTPCLNNCLGAASNTSPEASGVAVAWWKKATSVSEAVAVVSEGVAERRTLGALERQHAPAPVSKLPL